MKYNKIITLYNKWHLGDNIFNILFFNKLQSFLMKNNILIKYYLQSSYKKQVSEFLNNKNVILLDYEETNPKMGRHLWICADKFKFKWSNELSKVMPYNVFYSNFYNQLLKIWKFPIRIKSIIYNDNSLINRYNNLDQKYKNIDILFINSIPLSNQFEYEEEKWINFINNFTNYKIITTKKIPNINCTLDDDLTVKDIASLSTHCKLIIMINTGIVPGLFNIYTLKNVKMFYNLDKNCFYNFISYPKFKNYKYLDEIEINDVLNNLQS